MAQSVEEGLRQQAVNRAQRVKKQMQGNFAEVQSGSLASDDNLPSKHLRLTDISSSAADDSLSGDQLAGGSHVTERPCLASEIELVMRPHPHLSKHDDYDSQTRFIKTTSNATGFKQAVNIV